MRFVWEKKQAGEKSVNPGCGLTLFRLAYNAAWLLPIIMTFNGRIDYLTGFTIFSAVCVMRFMANLYANNALTGAQYDSFLLRA
ncbi:MAG: hypothetical protein RLP44_12675 [Aggregatilineales bacterium]